MSNSTSPTVIHAAVWRYLARDRSERVKYVYVVGDRTEAQRLANADGGYLRFEDSYEFPSGFKLEPDSLKPFPHCFDDTEAIPLELMTWLDWHQLDH